MNASLVLFSQYSHFTVVTGTVDAGEDQVSEEVKGDKRHQQPVSLWSRQQRLG